MKLLKKRILRDGALASEGVLRVDSFINFQVDVELTDLMGREFARIFAGSGATKVFTVEASGIPAAYATAVHMGNLPLIFAKKARPSTASGDDYCAQLRSFTKGNVSIIRVPKKYLSPSDRVLIIDDFLATGSASLGLLELLNLARASCVGVGALIEKEFQGGRAKLEERGVKVESLARIKSIKEGRIEFAEED